jgi:hypothetical protein
MDFLIQLRMQIIIIIFIVAEIKLMRENFDAKELENKVSKI